MAYAFHKATVTRNYISKVINKVVAIPRRHHPFRQRHADGVANALTKRSRRRFDTRGVSKFWVSGGAAAKFPKIFNFVNIYIRVSGEIK